MMAGSNTQAALLEQAQARLARTRLALLAQMRRDAPPPREGSTGPRGQGAQDPLWEVLHRWWQDHPAHMVLSLAAPVISAYARARPGRLLLMAAGSGALVMWLRPWRLLSLTALAVAAARSMPLADLLAAWRSQAEQARQAAREHADPAVN